MSAPPSDVRTGLAVVTATAAAEVAATLEEAPAQPLDLLMEFVPSLVDLYLDATAALALEWYEELREEAGARAAFTPTLVTNLDVAKIRDSIGYAVRTTQRELEALTIQAEQESLRILERLLPPLEREIATGFWDTTTDNTRRDPEATGWQRFARPGACPFCRFLADKGAIFKKTTANFAAHTNCKCVVRAAFKGGDYGPEASVLQYVASKKNRTAADRERLRAALVKKYGSTSSSRASSDPAARDDLGFDRQTAEWMRQQIAITEGLPTSEWQRTQLARLRERLAALD